MKKFIIYTDGSHLKAKGGSGRMGTGGILVDPDGAGPYGKVLGTYSQELTPEFINVHYNTTDCSNPFAEMMAALQALENFRGDYTDKDLVVIKADYIGVKEWFNPVKPWKITKPYIKKVYDEIREIIRKENLNVVFEWIPGHQAKNIKTSDAYYNNMVDKLAKGEE